MGRISESQKLEEQKKKRNKNIFLIVMIILGVIVAIFVQFILGIVVALTPLIVNAMLDTGKDLSKKEENLEKKVQEELAPKVIQLALPEARYLPDEGLSLEEYKKAEFTEQMENYVSNDKIIIGTKLNESKIKIEFNKIKYSDLLNNKKTIVAVVGSMSLPKDIRSKIKIGREGTCKSGSMFKLDIDNENFEKTFDVMSPNKNLAKSIVKEELINKIQKLYDKYSYIMEINIIRDKLYIKVECEDIIKETNDGRIIDRIVMEKRYTMIADVKELMLNIYDNVNMLEI